MTNYDERDQETRLRSSSTRKGNILLVDDDALVRRAFRRLLAIHDVVEAESGKEALQRIREFPYFDVVLCDLVMPVMDGPSLFTAVQHSFPMLVPRIVFVTGDSCDPYASEFLKRTKAKVIQKPVNHESLRGVVQRLARGSGFFPPTNGQG